MVIVQRPWRVVEGWVLGFGEQPASERIAVFATAAVIWVLTLEAVRLASFGAFGSPRTIALGFGLLSLGTMWWALSVETARRASAVVASLLLVAYGGMFPDVSNHSWLTLYLLVFACLSDFSDSGDRVGYTALTRLSVASVLFYSGLHKVLLHEWRSGEIFLHMTSMSESVPVQVLQSLVEAAGFSDAPATARRISANTTWILEVALGVSLLCPGARRVGVWACVLFMCVVQASAGEYYFAALVGIALTVVCRDRALNWVVAFYVGALTIRTSVDVVSTLG